MDIERAKGIPWVLLPGTLCTGAVFDGFLDELRVPRAARHVVALRHGNVEDHADELIRAVGRGAVVCGFSLGAILAAHLADRLQASAFVLFGLNPLADDPAKREGRLALADDVAREGGRAALASRLPPFAGADPATARALVLAMAEASAPDITAQTRLAMGRPGALEALARTKVPVLVFTGTDDSQAPLALGQQAARAAPFGRAIPLPGLGHYALVEDAALCARAVATALEGA